MKVFWLISTFKAGDVCMYLCACVCMCHPICAPACRSQMSVFSVVPQKQSTLSSEEGLELPRQASMAGRPAPGTCLSLSLQC